MKVLQINCVYGKGSTGRIVRDLHNEYIKNGVDSIVVYGRGNAPENGDANVIRQGSELFSKLRSGLSRIDGDIYGKAFFNTRRIEKIIEKERPDIVHLHCINGNFCNVFALAGRLKSNKIKTVLTQHAEFFYTGNCGYAFDCEGYKTGCRNCPDQYAAIGSRKKGAAERNFQKMKSAFDGFEDGLRPTGVSDWITGRSNGSAILGGYKCVTVMNGTDTDTFRYFPSEKAESGKNVIFVTPYFEDENKGGQWLLKLAKRFEGEDVRFTVVGDHNREYDAPNVVFTGRINDPKKLALAYSGSDACVLTSRRESFSMVCAESLCCGTPIAGFKAGAPEMISLKDYSSFVEYGDIDALENALRELLDNNFDKAEISEKAKSVYSKKAMADGYIRIYKELIGG